jgi:DNA recombination protein RmuC
MESFIFLGIGLAVGAVVGWLLAGRKAASSVVPDESNDLRVQLASAQATIAGLTSQLTQAATEKRERDERDREENKLLQALAPVKVHLEQMQLTVASLEKERTEQFGSIQQQLKSAIESDEQLRKQTQALSQALTSNNVRGVWGEAQLRKLVELAGLIKHADFDEQATISTNAGAGRADMVINLPGGKSLAIDSKVPFSDAPD